MPLEAFFVVCIPIRWGHPLRGQATVRQESHHHQAQSHGDKFLHRLKQLYHQVKTVA